MTSIEPEGRSSLRLAEAIGARHLGVERGVQRLCAPERPQQGGLVVRPALAPDTLDELAASGLTALVTSAADEARAAELEGAAERANVALLLVEDTRLALARLSRLLDSRPAPAEPGVHESAAVHESARLGSGVSIGACAVVSAGAVLGERVVVGPSCHVGVGVSVGADSVLFSQVTLYDGVTLGRGCRVHAGAVIGSDGFGYAMGPNGAEKIHHLAGVEIGDEVEIGANTCIDRGTLLPTRIGSRSKLDNLVQIGHNVTIGEDVVVVGMTGIAGSARIGDRAVLAAMVGVGEGVEVGTGARLAARAGVTKDVPAGETWGGWPAQPFRRFVRELYLIGRLESIWQTVRGTRGTPAAGGAKTVGGAKTAGGAPAAGGAETAGEDDADR